MRLLWAGLIAPCCAVFVVLDARHARTYIKKVHTTKVWKKKALLLKNNIYKGNEVSHPSKASVATLTLLERSGTVRDIHANSGIYSTRLDVQDISLFDDDTRNYMCTYVGKTARTQYPENIPTVVSASLITSNATLGRLVGSTYQP